MIVPRIDEQNRIAEALDEAPAVVLLGPRQIGKTTLVKEIAAAHAKETIYLDLEKDEDLRKLGDAGAFLRAQTGKLVILDEVHRTPELFTELRGIIDERRAAGERTRQFLLLGSASLDLIQTSSETLAGRITYIELGPIMPGEASAVGIGIDELWLRGGFPDSLTAKSDRVSFNWRKNFIRSCLERDVPMFAPRMPGGRIRRLWQMLANGQGTMLNTARLGQSLDVSAPMVNRYIDLLDDLLLVRRLPPWSGNVGKRLVKSPKIYVRDSGLVHALLDIASLDGLLGHIVCGPSWEGFVIEALIQAAGPDMTPFFYRTQDGAEIDLLFEKAGRPAIALEIKRSSAPRLERGFHLACDALDVPTRILVGSDIDSYPAKNGVTVQGLNPAMATVQALARR